MLLANARLSARSRWSSARRWPALMRPAVRRFERHPRADRRRRERASRSAGGSERGRRRRRPERSERRAARNRRCGGAGRVDRDGRQRQVRQRRFPPRSASGRRVFRDRLRGPRPPAARPQRPSCSRARATARRKRILDAWLPARRREPNRPGDAVADRARDRAAPSAAIRPGRSPQARDRRARPCSVAATSAGSDRRRAGLARRLDGRTVGVLPRRGPRVRGRQHRAARRAEPDRGGGGWLPDPDRPATPSTSRAASDEAVRAGAAVRVEDYDALIVTGARRSRATRLAGMPHVVTPDDRLRRERIAARPTSTIAIVEDNGWRANEGDALNGRDLEMNAPESPDVGWYAGDVSRDPPIRSKHGI